MNQNSEQILRRVGEAQYWAERMAGSAPLDTETSTAFVVWTTASPENLLEYVTQCALDQALRTSGLLASRPAEALPRRDTFARSRPTFWDRHSSRLIAAGILGVAVAVGITLLQWKPPDDWRHYTALPNSPQEISLDDGSIVSLYGNSSIAVRYSSELRAVRLDEGGGRFQVHPETARAFRVSVPGGSFEAVGTDFNLLRKGDETGLFVAEGAVRVRGLAQPDSIVVTEGESTDLSTAGRFGPARRYDDTRLQFEASTLKEIAEAFNSRNRVPQFHVEGKAQGRHIGGRVNVNDPQQWIRGLESMGEFDVEQHGDIATIRLKDDSTR